MNWKQERDALIAQTIAFVQSVTGRKQDAGSRSTGIAPAVPPVPVPSVPPAELPAPPVADVVATPKTIAPAQPVPAIEPVARANGSASHPFVAGDLANEIRDRIAGFRAHQERFNREREEYFSQTLAKLKAQINEMPPPRADK